MPDSPVPETITLRLPSRLELLAVLDRVAQTVCERMEFDEDTSSQVSMSVIEAGTNAVQHGHKRDPSKFFEVEFRLFPDRLEMDVRDSGKGFDVAKLVPDVTVPEHLLDMRGRAVLHEMAHGAVLAELEVDLVAARLHDEDAADA